MASYRQHVCALRCTVCMKFTDSIRSCRNFNSAFIDGSTNFRVSSFKEHAKTDIHARAMMLLKKKRKHLMLRSTLPLLEHSVQWIAMLKGKGKFDVAYMLAKEGIAFSKMKPVCQLMERHKVYLGMGYKNNMASSTFVDYIARDLRDELSQGIHKSKFFSIQMDGSTDSANVEEKLFLALYFDPYSSDGSVHLRSRFLCIRQPRSGNAKGLHECFGRALSYMGIDVPHKLTGFGCDEANVNIGERAL